MPDFQQLFEAAPDAYIVLKPQHDFTIVAASDGYLRATMTDRSEIIGKPLFEIFPQTSGTEDEQSIRVLRAALERTLTSRSPQHLSRYPGFQRPEAAGAGFERQQWNVQNVPIISDSGDLQYILHRLEEVSAQGSSGEDRRQYENSHKQMLAEIKAADQKIASRDHELARTHEELAAYQRELRETETRLEAAAQVGEIATWIWDLESDRVFADENLTRWHQLSNEVAHGGPFAAYLQSIHTDDVAEVSETIHRALSSDETVQVEYRIPGDVVPWRWVVARARIERNEDGEPVRLVGVVRDVTEQHETSQALQVVEERLSLAAEAAEIGSFSWSMPPGDLVSNTRCKEHFWLPPDAEVTPEKLYSMVHPQDRHPAHEAIDRAIENHTSFDGEYRTVSPHGQIRWVRAKGRAYYDASGNAIRFDGITLDNTRQRQIEAELKGSEARYRLLVDSLEDYAVFMQDDEGNVTSWNTGAERLLGYSEEEIIGGSTRIFFTPEDQARGEFEKEIRTAKATGRSDDDRWHVRKDGSRFFVTGMMVALYDDQNQRIGLAKIMRDITDRQRAIAERERLLDAERKARAEAERTSRLKDEFLATLSHELRTPLNAILGWTQVLKEGARNPAELDQALEVIDRNTRLQAGLIEDLLDMSRIVSGKIRLNLRTINITEVVASAIESVRTLADTRRIKLESSLPADRVELTADRHRLQQIVLNLLSNALKFTPPDGRVSVAVDATPNDVRILVSDTGVGIERDFLPHVFERFRQADASTTRQHGGLGLGLSIVKQLVDLHGGSVRADSPGKRRGATFEVSLPRTTGAPSPGEPPAQMESTPQPVSGVDLRGVRVLVVDDEPDSAGLMKRVLESRHAEVRAAGSMLEALEIFHDFHPHILLSDIGMPQHDGYELIKRVRELPGGEIPAAALTALARRDDVDRALHAGFQTHVAKPVEPTQLVTVAAGLAGIEPPSPK